MFNARNASIAALVLAAGLPSSAQAIKIGGLAQIWYSQMLDSNLRQNTAAAYYPMRSELRENGLSIRRTDIKLSGSFGEHLGKAFDALEWEVMFDPSLSSDVLQDLAIKYRLPNKIEIRAGQFKPYQTLDGMTSSSEILFAERSMLGRVFGDPRDRGIAASIGFGDTKAFSGRLHAGVFSGNNGQKVNDANAQKDFVARLDMNYGKNHYFGAYTMQGSTNLRDVGTLVPLTFSSGPDNTLPPTDEAILDNKDKSSNLGAFYRYKDDRFLASFEFITGLLGRRNASLGTAAGNAARQHLDQSFLGYTGTFAYTIAGQHTLVARYDYLNYNQGDKWYTDTNPYKTAAGDYTPEFTEISLGYTYAVLPDKVKNANIKFNYVMRSKNTHRPRAGQTGEQGGDSIVVCFQVAF